MTRTLRPYSVLFQLAEVVVDALPVDPGAGLFLTVVDAPDSDTAREEAGTAAAAHLNDTGLLGDYEFTNLAEEDGYAHLVLEGDLSGNVPAGESCHVIHARA